MATPAGRAWALPGRYAQLAEALLAGIQARWGDDVLKEAIHEAARQYVQGMELLQTRMFKRKVEALQKALHELRVPVRLEKRGVEHTLTLLGCVFPEMAERFPQTYDFYRALAEEILGVEVELQRPKAEDPLQTCTLRFQAS